MRRLLVCCAWLCLATGPATALDRYYYSSNEQIQLDLDSLHMVVKCDDQYSPQDQTALLASLTRVVLVQQPPQMAGGFLLCSLALGTDYEDYLDSVVNIPGIQFVEPVFGKDSLPRTLVGDIFVVRFAVSVTHQQIDSINAAFNVVLDHQFEGLANTYILRNTDSTGMHITNLANRYFELPETEWSHPSFTIPIVKTSYQILDHYSSYQLHSKKVIGQFNQASVWDFAGLRRPVPVAVIDDGITWHDDLPSARILQGRDFYANPNYPYQDGDPRPGPSEAHGMGCAGIIAASHSDSIGYDTMLDHSYVFGLDPWALVRPVKIFPDVATSEFVPIVDTVLSWAIRYAGQNSSVLSNSWAFFLPNADFDAINDQLQVAADSGRNGRGCVIVFSSGNSGGYPTYFPVGYPARHPACFAVGASDLTDHKWDYSQAGSRLDVVAPSGSTCLQGDVWSLDQMSTLGYNPNVTYCDDDVIWNCGSPNDVDYDCHFGGTSGACPLVAGAAALVLAKEPNLLASDVYNILRQSADTTLAWGTNPRFTEQYGYGLVDAFGAILSISHGDVNNDGYVADLSDLSALVAYTTTSSPKPFPSPLLADWNCSGGRFPVDLTDLSLCIAWVTGSPNRVPPVKPCFKF